LGVGHEPQPLADMRGADAVCAQYCRPNGVAFALHVCTNSIEPAMPHRAFNLLSKDRCRAALADEVKPDWPEVTLVVGAELLAGKAEWLAGA
jgi:hypothetical protein